MPRLSRQKIIKQATVGGLIGGAMLAAGQILFAAASGQSPGAPWQMAASVALGEEGMEGRLDFIRFFLGGLVHFGLSAFFGALFGVVVARIDRPVRNNLTLELAGGAFYGVVIWAFVQQILGRLLFPWMLRLDPVPQFVLHAVFYGVPMATWLALHIRDVEVPGVHAKRHRFQTSTGDEEYLRLRRWEEQAEQEFGEAPPRPPLGGEERPSGPTLH